VDRRRNRVEQNGIGNDQGGTLHTIDNYTFIIYKVNMKIRFQFPIATVENPALERLMENVQMQGFRNPEE
jgi:hypothetical protein